LNIAGPAKPRILLADDHIPFLASVSRHLSAYDIVATAGDGRQALDLARRLRPDVVVLDVTMPGLNGFQTLEQLRRDGSDTKVVFLTLHRDEEIVAAAINAGANGYVLKTRIHWDLISAIDHALAGRLFVPSLTSLSSVAGHRHTVQFHANDSDFLDEVSELVGATLQSDEQVVIVANEATRNGVAERLLARRTNLVRLAEQGLYVAQDSAVALSQLLHKGQPDRERLAEMIHGLNLLRLAGPNGARGRLTIFGDMSACLCRNGEFEAAQALERMWDELTRALPFFTICSYPVHCFDYPEGRHQHWNVCAAHSAVTFGTSRGIH
jgi:DNA-binding NarL/FixJ family response regulator